MDRKVCEDVMLGTWIASLLALAGQSPLVQAATIILAHVRAGRRRHRACRHAGAARPGFHRRCALASLFVGIVLGDLGLYGLGRLSARLPLDRAPAAAAPQGSGQRLAPWPGVQGRAHQPLPAGTAAADLHDLRLSSAPTCASSRWRPSSPPPAGPPCCSASRCEVGQFLMDHFGAWRWAGAAGFVVFVILAGRLAAAGLQSERR